MNTSLLTPMIKILASLLLSLYWLLLSPWGMLPSQAMPTTFSSPDLAGSAQMNSGELIDSEVDHYLTELPKMFWALRDVDSLREQIEHQSVTVIDVREFSEYESGHIPSAINIPLRTLTQNLSQIPQDRPVVLYCSSGYRSAMGVMALHLLGFENVQGFPPSIQGWIAHGEIVEGPAA